VGDKLFCGDLAINAKQMATVREEGCLKVIESSKGVLKSYFKYAFTGVGSRARAM